MGECDLVFGHYLAGAFDEQEERIEYLRLELDDLGAAQEAVARGVYAEGAELVEVAYLSAHI